MQRAFAGSTWAPTFTVTTGGTFTSTVWDAIGREVKSSVAEAAGTATITVNKDAWHDGAPGIGRLEIQRESGGVTSTETSERFRILPGLDIDTTPTDYAW